MKRENGNRKNKSIDEVIGSLRGLHPITYLREKRLQRLLREGCPEDGNTKMSASLSTAAVLLAVIAAVLLIFTLIFGGNTLGVDNLYYLYRDIASMNRTGETIASTLSYTAPESGQDFALYKKGLAVAGDREIKIFNATGRVTLTLGSELGEPRIIACDKYVLIYDAGHGGFSVYNSFDRLYSEKTDFAIGTAALSEDGNIAIVTRSKEYRSEIVIYDSEFSRICSYGKNDYVTSVAFDDSGRYLAIVSLDSFEGDYKTTFTVFDCNRSEIRSQTSFDGILAYDCDFISADRFALFCSDRFLILDLSCKKENEYMYGEGRLDMFSCGDGNFAMLLETDGVGEKRELMVFDRFGNESFRKSIMGECTDVAVFDRYVYLALDGRVERIDTRTGKVLYAECDTHGARILVSDSDKIIVCDSKSANIIDTWK